MSSVLIKENLKRYYNQEAELRNSKSVIADWKLKGRAKFFELLMQERKETLLELGAGAGYDSLFFMDNGLKVLAVDLSSEMVSKCREKSIEAQELDYYDLSSLNKKFDCVYAMNTLLHVPKDDLRHVLKEIDSVLNANGLFYMGLYGGGDTEKEFVKIEVSETPRFFALHSERFLKEILQLYFDIIDFETLDIGSGSEIDIFHSITLRKT
jgi:cyclopropane fatty-acyl-phospholipid synthase-like methyltransferase